MSGYRPLVLRCPSALWDAFIEIRTMSAGQRQQLVEDVLLDALIAKGNSDTVLTIADAKLFILPILKEWGEFEDDLSSDNLSSRLAIKLTLFNTTKAIPNESKLGKLLQLTKGLKITESLLVLYTNEDGKGKLSIRVPALDMNNETSVKTLAALIELACVMHSVQPNHCYLLEDDTLDKSPLEISGSLAKLLGKLVSSARNPYGHYDGANVVFGEESTFQCTPPGLLAAMRLLNQKEGLLRKVTYKKESKQVPVTAHMLQEKFNTIFGIKSKGDNASFSIRILKAILASSSKLSNKGFPGGFIHSNRTINKVKSDSALLIKMGWTPKVPSQVRLSDVLFNTVDNSTGIVDGKTKVIGRSLQNISQKGRNMSFQEFRTAVVMTVPKLDFSAKKFDEQLKVDSLDNKISPTVISKFVDPKMQKCVNSLQQAYSIKVQLSNPKSKSKLVHYEAARNSLLASTANMTIIDAKGNKFENFSKLPSDVQSYLRKKYRYPVKRQLPEAEVTQTESADVIMAGAATTVEGPPLKRSKRVKTFKTRAQATAARIAEGNKRVTRSSTK